MLPVNEPKVIPLNKKVETTTVAAPEKKVSIFGAAKVKPATKAAKDDKIVVEITGLEKKLLELNSLKAEIADREAMLAAITDEVKSISKEKFIELYKANKTNPNTFLIKDGEGCVTVIPVDKYIIVKDEARANQLIDEYGKEVVTVDEKYYFNPEVLERNQDVIEELISNSTAISESDKENMLKKEVKYSIAKGMIDELYHFGNKMENAIADIQPIFMLKNCGGKAEEGGVIGSGDLIDDVPVKLGYSLCCFAPVYGDAGICSHCGEKCTVMDEDEVRNELAEAANEGSYAEGGNAVVKFESLKEKCAKDIYSKVMSGFHFVGEIAVLSLKKIIEEGKSKSGYAFLKEVADRAYETVMRCDVREIGQLAKTFPDIMPKFIREGHYQPELTDNGWTIFNTSYAQGGSVDRTAELKNNVAHMQLKRLYKELEKAQFDGNIKKIEDIVEKIQAIELADEGSEELEQLHEARGYAAGGNINGWSDEMVNKVFSAMLDEMDVYKAEEVKRKHATIEQKKKWLKGEENKFSKQFAQGGAIHNQYAGKTPEQVWGMWNFTQRNNFLTEQWSNVHKTANAIADAAVLPKDHYSRGLPPEKHILVTKDFAYLPKAVQETIKNHVEGGQYAGGGEVSMTSKQFYSEDGQKLTQLIHDHDSLLNRQGYYSKGVAKLAHRIQLLKEKMGLIADKKESGGNVAAGKVWEASLLMNPIIPSELKNPKHLVRIFHLGSASDKFDVEQQIAREGLNVREILSITEIANSNEWEDFTYMKKTGKGIAVKSKADALKNYPNLLKNNLVSFGGGKNGYNIAITEKGEKPYYAHGGVAIAQKEFEISVGDNVYWGNYHYEGNKLFMDSCETMDEKGNTVDVYEKGDIATQDKVYSKLEDDTKDEVIGSFDYEYATGGGVKISQWDDVKATPYKDIIYIEATLDGDKSLLATVYEDSTVVYSVDAAQSDNYAQKVIKEAVKSLRKKTRLATGGEIGTKYKLGDFVFARLYKDQSIKTPFIVSHWSHDAYYILGDGSHYVKEEKLEPATEKDFDDYYGEGKAKEYSRALNMDEFGKPYEMGGNAAPGEWVVYNDETDTLIGKPHSNRAAAKRAMNNLFKTGKYTAIGMETKAEWDSTHKHIGGGDVGDFTVFYWNKEDGREDAAAEGVFSHLPTAIGVAEGFKKQGFDFVEVLDDAGIVKWDAEYGLDAPKYSGKVNPVGKREDGGMSNRKWMEIKNDFTDDEGVTHIDAFLTEDDNEEGKVIATIDKDGNVTYIDDDAKTDPYAQEMIKEITDQKFADGGKLENRKELVFTAKTKEDADRLEGFLNGSDNYWFADRDGLDFNFPVSESDVDRTEQGVQEEILNKYDIHGHWESFEAGGKVGKVKKFDGHPTLTGALEDANKYAMGKLGCGSPVSKESPYYDYGKECELGSGLISTTFNYDITALKPKDYVDAGVLAEVTALLGIDDYFQSPKLGLVITEVIQPKESAKKFYVRTGSCHYYGAKSNEVYVGVWIDAPNDSIKDICEKLKRISKDKRDEIMKGVMSYLYFNLKKSSKELSRNSRDQGIGSAASTVVTHSDQNVYDVKKYINKYGVEKLNALIKSNFHFNRAKNVKIDSLLGTLTEDSSVSLTYD